MARVKTLEEASSVTILSKNRRWDRLKKLFNITVLSELFPRNATPNNAGDNHLKCSGDVLRDLCLIGEVFIKRGLNTDEMKDEMKQNFVADVAVRHMDVKTVLEKVRATAIAANIPIASDDSYVPNLRAIENEGRLVQDGVEEFDDQVTSKNTTPESNGYNTLDIQEQLPGEEGHALGKAIQGEVEERQESLAPSSGSKGAGHYNMFNEVGADGPRRAKLRAAVGITEVTEMEDLDAEYEEDDVIPGSSPPVLHTASHSMQPSFPPPSLSKPKPMKRKSAPGAMDRGSKRSRSQTTNSGDYDQCDRDTLVSCLRMTYALIQGMEPKFEAEDFGGIEKQTDIIRGMVEQVLTRFTEA